MTVFAVHPDRNGHDLSPVLQYGDIRYVNSRYVYGDEIENCRLPYAFDDALDAAACDFDPDQDFLLIMGDTVQLVAFVFKLTVAHDGRHIRALRWDKKAAGYLVVRLF